MSVYNDAQRDSAQKTHISPFLYLFSRFCLQISFIYETCLTAIIFMLNFFILSEPRLNQIKGCLRFLAYLLLSDSSASSKFRQFPFCLVTVQRTALAGGKEACFIIRKNESQILRIQRGGIANPTDQLALLCK